MALFFFIPQLALSGWQRGHAHNPKVVGSNPTPAIYIMHSYFGTDFISLPCPSIEGIVVC
jgi:hypothetical protein